MRLWRQQGNSGNADAPLKGNSQNLTRATVRLGPVLLFYGITFYSVLRYAISLNSVVFEVLFIGCLGARVLVAVTPQSVRERINLTESAVSDDVMNRPVTGAAETLKLETDLAIDPGDCTDAEDAEVPKDKRGRKRVFLLREECRDER